MYNVCPFELKVNFGANGWSLVIITLQSAPACQIRSVSFSISRFNSIIVLGSSLSSNASKNEYL